VHDIQTHFFEEDGRHFWSVAIKYEVVLQGEDKIRALDDAQQVLYSRLREWRKEHAGKMGIPVYLIATNAHFLQMVKFKCRTMECLKQVKGFGRKRQEKYGRYIINIIKDFYDEGRQKSNQKSQVSDPDSQNELDDFPFS
jgi:superfamily II DNA helicase RecQ